MWCVRLEGRSFYKDGEWNTLCLPFNVTIYGSCLNGATIKELDIEEPSLENGYEHVTGVEESTLYLNFKDVTDQIVAGKPYIIKWEPNQNNLNDPIFENASLSDLISGAIEPVPVNSLNGEVSFTGVFFSKDIEDENGDNTMLYLGSGNTTYYPSASMSINAMRAYFQLNGYRVEEQQGGGTVNVFTLNFDNETTAVKRIESKENQSEVVYDLSGRIVESDCLQPGIYIRGGKKFLIRK